MSKFQLIWMIIKKKIVFFFFNLSMLSMNLSLGLVTRYNHVICEPSVCHLNINKQLLSIHNKDIRHHFHFTPTSIVLAKERNSLSDQGITTCLFYFENLVTRSKFKIATTCLVLIVTLSYVQNIYTYTFLWSARVLFEQTR